MNEDPEPTAPGQLLPSFLQLPDRTQKPRAAGLTHVLDKGIPKAALQSWLNLVGSFIDILKLGWGTAYVTAGLSDKIALCQAEGVRVSTGGTLLEVAAAQRKVPEFTAWARESGFDIVEVSNGALDMPGEEKRRLIRGLSKHFTVFSEVGSKNALATVESDKWAAEIEADLEAGAAFVILEGRESGTVGLYNSDGSVRQGLVEQIVESVDHGRLIFEAPIKNQQAWLINMLGPEVNLGNVAPGDALSLESMRLGLRADTSFLALPVHRQRPPRAD